LGLHHENTWQLDNIYQFRITSKFVLVVVGPEEECKKYEDVIY
jgi:hypothetical protein